MARLARPQPGTEAFYRQLALRHMARNRPGYGARGSQLPGTAYQSFRGALHGEGLEPGLLGQVGGAVGTPFPRLNRAAPPGRFRNLGSVRSGGVFPLAWAPWHTPLVPGLEFGGFPGEVDVPTSYPNGRQLALSRLADVGAAQRAVDAITRSLNRSR